MGVRNVSGSKHNSMLRIVIIIRRAVPWKQNIVKYSPQVQSLQDIMQGDVDGKSIYMATIEIYNCECTVRTMDTFLCIIKLHVRP